MPGSAAATLDDRCYVGIGEVAIGDVVISDPSPNWHLVSPFEYALGEMPLANGKRRRLRVFDPAMDSLDNLVGEVSTDTYFSTLLNRTRRIAHKRGDLVDLRTNWKTFYSHTPWGRAAQSSLWVFPAREKLEQPWNAVCLTFEDGPEDCSFSILRGGAVFEVEILKDEFEEIHQTFEQWIGHLARLGTSNLASCIEVNPWKMPVRVGRDQRALSVPAGFVSFIREIDQTVADLQTSATIEGNYLPDGIIAPDGDGNIEFPRRFPDRAGRHFQVSLLWLPENFFREEKAKVLNGDGAAQLLEGDHPEGLVVGKQTCEAGQKCRFLVHRPGIVATISYEIEDGDTDPILTEKLLGFLVSAGF